MRLHALPSSVFLLATLAVPQIAHAAVPSVTGIEPSAGQRGGGMILTIRGSNFGCAPRAFVGGRFAPTLFADDTTLVVDTPPSSASGPASVRVLNGDGSSSAVSYDYEGPWISSVTPSSCPQTGGISITISGSSFGSSPKVYFGVAEAPILGSSDTQVVCLAPRSAGTRGASYGGGGGGGLIALVASTGLSSNTADFSYDQGPLVVSVSPAAGRAAGGTHITIVGENFGQGAACLVGGQAAPVVSSSSSRMVVVAPPGAAGDQDLVVVSGGLASPPAVFSYLSPPSISGISPATASPGGGTVITINGENFGPDDDALTRQAKADTSGVGPVRWMAPEALRITAPPSPDPAAVVSVDVVVRVDGVDDTLHSALTYDPKVPGSSPPAIASVTSGGPVRGGVLVTVSGANFNPTGAGSPSVYFGSSGNLTPATSSDTQLTFVAPDAGAGTSMPLGVEVDGLASSSASLDYEAPSLTGISPSSGDHAGGTVITISGYFPASPQVLVGADAVEPLTSSRTQIVCNIPPDQLSSSKEVSVTGSGGGTGSSLMSFSGPVISSISPSSVSISGGTVLTISGSNFPPGASVRVDGYETFKNGEIPDQEDCVLPPGHGGGGGGGGVLVVRAGDLRSNHLGLTYDAALDPAIASVSPSEGRVSGGTLLTIQGSNFGLSPLVTMDGDTATVLCSAPGSIVCRSYGSGGGGGGAIYVGLLVGVATPPNAFVYPDAFTYLDPPQVAAVTPGSGPTYGGVHLTIQGQNFGTEGSGVARSVTVGGAEASDLTVLSQTVLTCTLPAAPDTGLVDVAVSVDSVTTVLPGGFLYQDATTGVGGSGLPARFLLAQNRPNPFQGTTRIEFAMPRESDYDLTVYDLAGRVVRRFTGHAGAGILGMEWDGRAANGEETAPGIYFYRMRAGGYLKTLRMVRLR